MNKGYKPPIIGSFEDIGKDVASEAAKVPTDVAGKILESLTGAPAAKGQKTPQTNEKQGTTNAKPDGALGAMEQTSDMKVKRAIARAALEQLAGKGEEKALSVWEEKEREKKEQKKVQEKQDKEKAFAELPHLSFVKRRGDLYGIKGKSSSETSKNVRQD